MYQIKRTVLKVWPAFAAMVVVAGLVSVALAQGSGTKPAGSASKAEAHKGKQKVHVKAELNAEALHAMIGAKVPMVLLDARGPSDQWIIGATPVAPDADLQTIRRAVGYPNRLIVTYCGGPECPASQMLANRLATQGYAHVIRFTGGIETWTKAGYTLKAKAGASGSATRKPSGSSPKPKPSGSSPKSSGSGSR